MPNKLDRHKFKINQDTNNINLLIYIQTLITFGISRINLEIQSALEFYLQTFPAESPPCCDTNCERQMQLLG